MPDAPAACGVRRSPGRPTATGSGKPPHEGDLGQLAPMCPAFDDGIRLVAVRDCLDDRNDRHKSLVTRRP
jgi:hypothetical protein